MTAALKKLERFKDIPIQVKDIVFKLKPSSRNISKTDKNETIVAGIVTSQDLVIRKQVARGCKTIWNVQKAEKAIERPLGMNFCYVEYFGDDNSPPANSQKRKDSREAILAQQHTMGNCKLIPIQGVRDFDYPVEYERQEVTLRQVLSTLCSKTDPLYREPLFLQINTTWRGNTVDIVHRNEEEEAKQVISVPAHAPLFWPRSGGLV